MYIYIHYCNSDYRSDSNTCLCMTIDSHEHEDESLMLRLGNQEAKKARGP